MFSFLQSAPFVDPELGEFRRTRGHWRGRIELTGSAVPLAVSGSRGQPDVAALAAAKALSTVWHESANAVARALVEHLQPYRDAVAAGEAEAPSQPLPRVGQSADIWGAVEVLSASVTPLGGKLTAEVALSVTWDEEHTLGARFQGPSFVELNGSILPE